MNRTVIALPTAATMAGILALGLAAPANAATSTVRTKALAYAKAQKGDPYSTSKPTGPNSWDCSGLIQASYRKAGKKIARTAQAQYNATVHVTNSKKIVGDLIFFGGARSIYHVGIYAGGNQIWHSPRPGQRVKLEKIWTSYRVGKVR